MFVIAAAALLVSTVVTGAVRRFALARGMLDVPNDRSSHIAPTPRGGGVAIVIAATIGCLFALLLGLVPLRLCLALSIGGAAVATIGFLDDRYRLSAGLRLLVHFAAAIWAVGCLGYEISWLNAVAVVAVVWAVNLFNFMDGIDGLAASEAVFIAWAGASLGLVAGGSPGVISAALIFGAACGGFLLWNWPPAKIFMGDAGSGYVGYFIAVLALAAAREQPPNLVVWSMLAALFVVDATITLARRFLRSERVMEAHRSHAYQWLARRWNSHRRVTVVAGLVNLLWLLPCALLAILHPDRAVWIAAAALTPIVAAVIVAGAGRREAR